MPETPAFDPRVQTEKIGFDADAMIACEGCGRMNPPTRFDCIYCAKRLTVSSTPSIKPALRKVENWERGFNVIAREQMRQPNVSEAARFLSMEYDDLATLLGAGVPLPIARVESESEAAVIRDRLSFFGIECSIVGDDDLAADKPPARLSALRLESGHFTVTDFNTARSKEIDLADLALIVSGVIMLDRVDSREKRRRGGKTKVIDEMAVASDEMLLDLYARQDKTGYRIHLTGFDFSCLGEDKSLLARENMRLLTVRLTELTPNAKLVDHYAGVRHILGRIWEVDSRKDSQGLQRSGLGKLEFGSTVSSSNLSQFTKYSRLQWHLL